MRKLFLLMALFMAFPFNADSAQVSPDEYIAPLSLYGRTDSLMQRRDTHGFDLFINGYRGVSVGKAVYEDFTEYGDGDDFCIQSDNTGCSGTAGEVNLIYLPSGNKMACEVLGTQTILGAVDMDAGSLDISGDQTADDGVECAWGVHGASGGAFTVGTDNAFYTCATFTIADVSGSDDFHLGFRVANDGDTDTGGFNQTFDNYHDLAALSMLSGDIYISTIAADAATSETDTTANWADAASHRFCVYVSAAGVTTFTVDGSAPPTTATYTFTDAESVIPFFHVLQDTDLTGEVDLTEWEVGYQ